MKVILVGITNNSAETETALELGHRLGLAFDAKIVGVATASRHDAEHSPNDTERHKATTRAEILRHVRPDLASKIQIDIVAGSLESALEHQAQQRGALSVIIGASEKSTSKLAHGLDCPLVVVPAPSIAHRSNDIVVGIDGSEANQIAVDTATEYTAAMGGTTHGVYVIDDIYTTFNPDGQYGKEEAKVHQQADKESRAISFVEHLGGRIEDGLAEIAEQHKALLVLVAAKERGSLGGAILGAVPKHLLKHPPCPVMVLPHKYTKKLEQDS